MPPENFRLFDEATIIFNGREVDTIDIRDVYLNSSHNHSNNDEREQRIQDSIEQTEFGFVTQTFDSSNLNSTIYTTEDRLSRPEDAVYNQQRPDIARYFNVTGELRVNTADETAILNASSLNYVINCQNHIDLNDNMRLYYKDIDELIEFRNKIDTQIQNHFKGK